MALLTQDEIYASFRTLPTFKKISNEALRRMAELVDVRLAINGETLYKLGQAPTHFFVIESGEVVLNTIDRWGATKRSGGLQAGDILGLQAVVRNEPYHETAIVAQDSTLFALTCEGWETLLREFPHLRRDLDKVVRFRRQRRLGDLKLSGDEQILIYTRPHWVVLLERIVIPLLFLGAGIIVSGLLSLFINDIFALFTIAFSVLVFLLIVVAYAFADYWTDVYVVTTSRVARTLRQPYIKETLREARIGKVQNTTVQFPNFFSRLLGWSNVIITTAGGSPIRFERVGNGPFINAVISNLVEEARQRGAQESRAARRARAEQLLSGAAPQSGGGATATITPIQDKGLVEQLWSGVMAVALYFIPQTRVEREGQIIYRKHWIELLKTSGVFMLVFFGALVGQVVLVGTMLVNRDTTMWPLIVVVGAIGLGLFIWLWWLYEDWRNDQYILTGAAVIDLERLPLYFREQEKRAGYDAIQDVSYEIPNPVAEILDYGNVVIETAGPLGRLTWDHIPHPRRVRAEIFEKMTAFQAKRSAKQREEREEELSDWLQVLEEIRRRDGTGQA